MASDPLIWEQHPDNQRWREDRFRVFFREAIESGGALVAIDPRTGRAIGSSRYFGHDPERSEIEIGWTFLARDYWGGPTNGEMKRLMLRHAFRFVERRVSRRSGEPSLAARHGADRRRPHGNPNRLQGARKIVYEITRESYESAPDRGPRS